MAQSFRAGGTPQNPIFSEDVREPAREVQPGWAEQFQQQFASPEARAALLQFGIAAMQPVGFGQNLAGHLGQAIGAGAEASGRVTEQERKKRKETFAEEEALFTRGQTERRTAAAEARAKRVGRGGGFTRSQQLTHQREIARRIERTRNAMIKSRTAGLFDEELAAKEAELRANPAFELEVRTAVKNDLAGARSLSEEPVEAEDEED